MLESITYNEQTLATIQHNDTDKKIKHGSAMKSFLEDNPISVITSQRPIE